MLISLEGIDGSGKSTQARLLEQHLESDGFPVILVREPGGTPLSERVRDLLLDPSLRVAPFAEVLLFSAARTQLVEERILPALAAGVVVICDRFYDSTTAYQAGGRDAVEEDWLRDFHRRVTSGLVPDRTYLIEVDANEASIRRGTRSRNTTHETGAGDRIEDAGIEFQREVARAYAMIAEGEPQRVRRIDGGLSAEAVHAQIWNDLRDTLPETSAPRSGSSF